MNTKEENLDRLMCQIQFIIQFIKPIYGDVSVQFEGRKRIQEAFDFDTCQLEKIKLAFLLLDQMDQKQFIGLLDTWINALQILSIDMNEVS